MEILDPQSLYRVFHNFLGTHSSVVINMNSFVSSIQAVSFFVLNEMRSILYMTLSQN